MAVPNCSLLALLELEEGKPDEWSRIDIIAIVKPQLIAIAGGVSRPSSQALQYATSYFPGATLVDSPTLCVVLADADTPPLPAR